jgi:hypothetical protein
MVNNWTSKYIGKGEFNGGSQSDWKKLRDFYKPKAISLLLVGEAPPEPSLGKFFYEGNLLTDYTLKAFQGAFPEILDAINHDCFLKQFKALGCYYDDLSLEPVNKRDAFERNYRLLRQVPKFIKRLSDSPPKTVVVVMKRIDYLVKYALDEAGLGALKISFLQYPSRSKKSIDGYAEQLREILIAERQNGVFPEIDLAKYCVFDAGMEKRSAARKSADRSHRVEIKLPGIPAYQFKVKDLSVKGASVLIKEDSGLVPHLEVDQVLNVGYYTNNKRNPEISFKARIKHMTKADITPFSGHLLVGFTISENGRKLS